MFVIQYFATSLSFSLSQNQSTLTQVQTPYKEVTTLYFVVQIILWCFFLLVLSTLSSHNEIVIWQSLIMKREEACVSPS